MAKINTDFDFNPFNAHRFIDIVVVELLSNLSSIPLDSDFKFTLMWRLYNVRVIEKKTKIKKKSLDTIKINGLINCFLP